MIFIRALIITTLLVSSVCFADNTNSDKLSEIKGKIDQQKSLLAKQKKQQRRLSNLLRDTDKAIASAASALFKTQQQQTDNRTKQRELLATKRNLTATQQRQQAILGQQLKSAYMAGNHDLMQLLLNQQQSSKTERLLGYYHYLNKARVEALANLKQTFIDLQSVEASIIDSLAQLDQLIIDQRQSESKLKQQKTTRKNALSQLTKSYLKNSAQLEQYQLSELDIKQLLAAQEVTPSIALPLKGLTKVKGRLAKPTKGRTTHKFGQKRHGQLRWKGVTIVGSEGQAVNAVYHGKVIFSDWIKGFGLVLVVDHGQGYMSLYGHNQALLKKAGDNVNQNEQIALLGQSGGQSTSGLYFEIRHKGKAINPARWFKK